MSQNQHSPELSPAALASFDVWGHRFPSFWKYLLPGDFTLLKLPSEKIADCSACPMVAVGQYDERCRCCTHLPQVSNYQLGIALTNVSSKDNVRRLIDSGYALPQGIELPPAKLRLYHRTYASGKFGNSLEIRCPLMLENGACGAYMFRTSVCSTFFCSNDHGEIGAAFWEALKILIDHIEIILAQWAMTEVGMDVAEYMSRKNALASQLSALANDSHSGWPAAVRAELFGDWFGRESSFFQACAKMVWSHRNELWTIAKNGDLAEAVSYECALEQFAQDSTDPQRAIVDKDQVEICESPVAALWDELIAAYDLLWRMPKEEEQLVLCDGVSIETNSGQDNVAHFFKDKAYCIHIPGNSDKTEPETIYLSSDEVSLLKLLEAPRHVNDEFQAHTAFQQLENANGFLSQCICNGILVIVP